MDNPRKNAEGYNDPTPYEAEKHMMAQLRGQRARAAGNYFEAMISGSCDYYRDRGLAKIEKTPEPMKPLGPKNRKGQFLACYTKQAQPDYGGTLKGGRSIYFEAKHTDDDRIEFKRLTKEQQDDLEHHHKLGAVTFVLVSMGLTECYRVPWPVWRDMADTYGRKYMTRAELLPYKVPVVAGFVKFLDKLLDLVLNGPTLNGFRKDEIRAALRQTYTALKQYEQIGPMASPYMNDPSAIVARAFAELYPGIDYHAQFVPDLCDESGNRAFGLTIFPDDGSTPIVCISAEAPISAAPELLAHELAHVATPEDRDHGEAWKAAEKAIGDKYDEILNDMIPDDDPGVLVPHEAGDGGILAMPLRDNIPDPGRYDWKLTTCPVCGAECWETEIARQALAAEPELRAACTACALRGGRSGR